MAEEKTEQPSEKRLRESRKKGQVSKSVDLTNAMLFLTSAGILSLGGAAYVHQLTATLTAFLSPEVFRGEMPLSQMLDRFGSAMARALILCAPLFGGVMIVAAASSFLQVKALFAPEAVKPKFDKLNPIAGFKNIFFKGKTYFDLAKNLVKFVVILALVYYNLKGALREVLLSSRLELGSSAQLVTHLVFRLLYQIGAVFLVIGAADFMMQKKFHMKNLMMSKEEVKKEFKESEGDPHIKHARKQLHEEMVAHSAVANVPKAKVVVVNPTHLAIALRYDDDSTGAPQVTAKGREELAGKIRELAEEHGVPVYRDVQLAHSLYALDLGTEIPEDLYEAVAEVLDWVYKLQRERES